MFIGGFPGGSDGKESSHKTRDPGLIPELERFSGEENGNPLQYSCLENPMDGGAWWTTVHRVTKSQTGLRDLTSLHFTSHLKENYVRSQQHCTIEQ